MSRSKKKHPGSGICSCNGQKAFRSQENRRKRRRVKVKLLQYTENTNLDRDLPHEKDYGNEWASPRDGKVYWLKPKYGWSFWPLEERVKEWLKIFRK